MVPSCASPLCRPSLGERSARRSRNFQPARDVREPHTHDEGTVGVRIPMGNSWDATTRHDETVSHAQTTPTQPDSTAHGSKRRHARKTSRRGVIGTLSMVQADVKDKH